MRARHGMTLIVVSHAREVADRADRVLQLVDGRVADDRLRPPPARPRPASE
jgi:predicted ABC-type transport system involved in lysophospholipase L1 biosynthesis ATPase subunit